MEPLASNGLAQRYRELQEQFDLPQLDELQKKFKISLETGDETLIEHIRDEVSDILFDFSEKIIEPLIIGENFCCEFEQKMLSKEEIDGVFEMYKKIQSLKWENNLLMISQDEKKAAEFIKKMWDVWRNDVEGKLNMICRKLADGWSEINFSGEKTDNHYTG
ncbi:MAG: hypothetical protein ABIG30_00495 [Candidatus Aenigmatarchaeota archaeon]